jgi:RNA polymerase sigma-B factor
VGPLSLVTEQPEHADRPHDTPDDLIEAHAPAARSMASRYRNRGIDLDDLEQVALVGLVKAAQRFDPDAGHDFLSYAVPTVRGEIRRHFRDHGWAVRPPRRVQELQAHLATADEALSAGLGRAPRPAELARHLGVPVADVVEALSADGCFTPSSLDAPVGEGSSAMGDLLGREDRGVEQVEARMVVTPLVQGLSERDRLIIGLRYRDELTQQEIADVVSLTQAQVSRILTRVLAEMRAALVEPPPAA